MTKLEKTSTCNDYFKCNQGSKLEEEILKLAKHLQSQ